ncbi:DUF6171 family protein [Litchfieldia salsa]|uniref:Uncharacterized protein n=1 Tax=Litchfieldia salsa TaxID=930152 RepID=A0A1H0PAB6_9BACI|nr:DUF6171 family protein [Litchfieldia salsa]SDP01963.1 hypothetical protein SAMN05216565_101228 [Litchfieldia salsa]
MSNQQTESKCKGCFRSPLMSDEQVRQLVEEQLQLETNLVSDELYESRLHQCKSCSSLSSQTTCTHCGCFVEFRARLGYKKCPNPAGAKW